MKYFILSLFLSLTALANAAEGIQFEHIPFKEALAKAQAEGKLIFLDAYASWCGPCKAMARNVFTDSEVAEFYNETFINLKVDMEKGEGPELKRRYRVSAFPTLLFINSDGQVIQSRRGGMRALDFIAFGSSVQKSYFDISKIEEQYNSGDHSATLLYDYAKGLKKKGEPYLKIANEYFRTEKVEYDVTFLDAIYDLTPHFDSKTFELFSTNLDALNAKYNQSQMKLKWSQLASATLSRAIEFKQKDLLDLAINTLKENSEEEDFASVANMSYYTTAEPNLSKYTKAGNAYLSSKTDNEDYYLYLDRLINIFPTKAAAKKGLPVVEKLLEKGEKAKYHLISGKIYQLVGDSEKATVQGEKAIEIATKDKLKLNPYKKFLKEIKK